MHSIDLETLLKAANERADRYQARKQRQLLRQIAAGKSTQAISTKLLRDEGARQRWRRARQQFAGLSRLLKARHDLCNIRRSRGGYEVVITRAGHKFSYDIAGTGDKSLKAAMKLRDELLREAPPLRKNAIPRRVLRELGLSEPVIGICRLASRSSYRVYWFDATGRRRLKGFYFRAVPEADAYAAAIMFREELDRERGLGRPSYAGETGWDESRGPVSILGTRHGMPRHRG